MDTKTLDKTNIVAPKEPMKEQAGNTTNLKIVLGILMFALGAMLLVVIIFTVTSIMSLNDKDKQIQDLKENITEITNLPTPTPIIIR